MKTASYMTPLGVFAIGFALTVSGCGKESSGKGIHAEQSASPGVATKSPSKPGAEQGHEGGKHAGGGDEDLVLKKVMTQLGVEMAGVSDGIWKDDLAKVAKHAGAIADHPHVGSKEKQRLMKALGKDFSEFVKADRRVHGAATRLKAAAGESDMDATLKELAAVQTGCVGCHASFRKRLAVR